MFTLDTSEIEILAWLRQQQEVLFPGSSFPTLQSFEYVDKLPRKWAGAYTRQGITPISGENGRIQLARNYFTSLTGEALDRAMRETLYHELTHHFQYAIDPYCETPHGKEFRKMAASINGKLQDDWVQPHHHLRRTPMGAEALAIQRKALALLSRTTSSNEHEAAIAASKYAELCAKFDFTLDAEAATLAAALPEIVDERFYTSKQASKWLQTLLAAVCRVHAGTLYWQSSQMMGTRWFVIARTTKVAQIYELTMYLTEAVERVVENARKERPDKPGRAFWSSYREGVARAVAQSLNRDLERRHAEGISESSGISHIPGLVLRSHFEKEKAAVQEYQEGHVGKMRTAASRRVSNSYAFCAGASAGRSISVSRQVTRSAGIKALNAG